MSDLSDLTIVTYCILKSYLILASNMSGLSERERERVKEKEREFFLCRRNYILDNCVLMISALNFTF